MIRKLVFGACILLLYACPTQKRVTGTTPGHADKPETTRVVLNTPPEPEVYQATVTRTNDLLHTRLEVSFDWQKQWLYGKATLTLKPYFYPTDKLTLDAKGMEIKSVALCGQSLASPLQYEYNKKQIFIQLPRVFKQNEQYQICIDYIAKPNELPKGGSDAIKGDKGLYFINPLGEEKNKPMQIWTQGETESNSAWFPTIDKPNERMTQEIYITVDKKYVTLSNGLFQYSLENPDGTRTDYWKQELPAAPYLTMMAIGEYAVVKDKWKYEGREIEVNYYVEKEYEKHARAIFGNTPEMLTFYSDMLGVPYPWEKYSQVVVRDFVSGAMENTTAVIHGEFLQRTDRELLDRDNEDVIAHELFHHWFGDLVTCESWANLPLNESFATYGEYLWQEYKYGRDEADYFHYQSMQGYLYAAEKSPKDLIRFDYENREDMFDSHSYNKGGQILHMLRKYVGDEAFYAALKLYLETKKFQAAEVHDLRLAFEQVTGEDLNWFFDQWFLDKGHPDLEITHNYNDSLKKYTVTLEQKQNFEKFPLFRLHMAIDLYAGGKVERHNIVMTKAKESFVFDVASRPDLVNVDAEKQLLCTKKEDKPLKELVFQYKNCPLWLDRYEALVELKKKPNDAEAIGAMISALDDKHWSLRSDAVMGLKNMISDGNRSIVKDKLIQMVKNDKKAQVRADALFGLSNFIKDADLKDVYKAALNDRSYNVLGDALWALATIDAKEAVGMAKQFENEKNKTLTLSVARVYAGHGSDEHLEFFTKAASRFSDWSAITFCGYLTNYLMRCSDETINKGVTILEGFSKGNYNKWIRYYGQKGVNDLIKMYQEREDSTKKKIDELKAANPNAPGLQKLQDDLVKIQAQKDKLTLIYNELVKQSEK